MRILDKDGNELVSYSEEDGYVVSESIISKHHAAIEAVEGQGHYETVAEYPNGGKDVEWIVDIPGVEAKDAYDEYEEILRYVPYDKIQLATIKINKLKQKLFETDYNILKIVEGAATLSECADVIKQRAAWRKEINELEKVTADGD